MPHQDTFSWNVMVAGYAQHGQLKQSFHLFQKMPKPNVISWNTVISGCCQHGELNKAKKLFKIMPVRDVISWNIMLAGYAKAGFVDEALEAFNQMPIRDTVSWNTVITAHAQQKGPSTALQLLQQMQLADMKPDNFTLACIIDACAGIADLAKGVEVHTYILEHGFRIDTVVCNALVNMYGKCGSLKDAKSVFDKMAQKNTTTWNIMITAYSQHGHGAEAVQLFISMVSNGVLADRVTFLGVLSACGHVGLADIGFFCFISMRQEYTITAAMDHFSCIIDSLGRAGWLVEAEVFVSSMPFDPDAACWRALLSYCRLYYDVFKGICAACNAFGIDPENAAAYISLSNIWAVDMAVFP